MDNNKNMIYLQEIQEALDYSKGSTHIDSEGNLIVKFSDGKKFKVTVSEIQD